LTDATHHLAIGSGKDANIYVLEPRQNEQDRRQAAVASCLNSFFVRQLSRLAIPLIPLQPNRQAASHASQAWASSVDCFGWSTTQHRKEVLEGGSLATVVFSLRTARISILLYRAAPLLLFKEMP
jgi:hypothetical protein